MIKTLHFLVLLCWASTVLAADIPGAKDHPLMSRYPGSDIIKYDQRAFDQVKLLRGVVQVRGGPDKNADALLPLEGKVTRIAYKAPEGRSLFEIYKNYEQALATAGFAIEFSCDDANCDSKFKGRAFNELATPKDLSVTMGFHEKGQRYLLARLQREDAVVHVAIYMVQAYSIGGANKDRIFANVQIVESAQMETGLVKVDAAAMAKGLDADGHIALYEIYFATDSAELKAQSDGALQEIVQLLTANPGLNILVVGHTDNQGQLEYNRQLSERRAQAVVKALAGRGIATARLTPLGVGMAAPVASNDSDAGRAKNRRVELVKR